MLIIISLQEDGPKSILRKGRTDNKIFLARGLHVSDEMAV